MNELQHCLDRLVDYAKKNLALDAGDADYVRNGIMDRLGVAFPNGGASAGSATVGELKADFAAAAVRAGVTDEVGAENLCDLVLGELSLKPTEINARFLRTESERGSKAAADELYAYCVANDYVKKSKLDLNPRFESNGLIITVNKAKPEYRDAKKAAAGNAVGGGYPACSICHENEGFIGRGKRTLRTVELCLGGQKWFWQFSPYGYFYQHGIAVNHEHIPMHVDEGTFTRLMDFADRFPHYFIGCNAALPRIGGSVLAHDHYQGGGETLPLHKAGASKTFECGQATVEALDWAGTAVRVVSKSREAIVCASERIRAAWVDYDAPELGIVARDADGEHNAVSPTVVKTARGYEMTIILRSNITSARYPDGVFHAHPEFHVIKKESIGLIEAQGLFILPGRLESELGQITDAICAGKDLPSTLSDYAFIYGEITALCGGRRDRASVNAAVRDELGSVCKRILENTAVFKDRRDLYGFISGVL